MEILLYLMSFYKPNIAYAVSRLSKYTQYSNQGHWDALAKLKKYLRGTTNYDIEYNVDFLLC